jgi:hypothetical protein
MLDRKNIDGNKAIKLYCLKIAQNQILTPVGWHLLANDREHDGVGVLGASTYDARRGEEWITTHITLKRCSDITTYQVTVEFARK